MIICCKTPTVIYIGPHICSKRTADLFIRAQEWSWYSQPDGKLEVNAWQVDLLTLIAKLCCTFRPPCHAKEPPSDEASSCLDKDFTPDIRTLQLKIQGDPK